MSRPNSTNKKNKTPQEEHCQWFTPPAVAEAFMAWSGLTDDMSVVDLAAGEGSLLPRRPRTLGFDIDPEVIAELRYWRPDAMVACCDALRVQPFLRFDLAIGNPPYADNGEASFTHAALRWAPRTTQLIRTEALNGKHRWENHWRFIHITRIAYLIYRPQFTSPLGLPSEKSPAVSYCAIEARLRPEPLPIDLPTNTQGSAPAEIEWVNWR